MMDCADMYMYTLACMFAFGSLHACFLDSHVNLWIGQSSVGMDLPYKGLYV